MRNAVYAHSKLRVTKTSTPRMERGFQSRHVIIWFLRLVFLALIFFCTSIVSAQEPTKRVLVITSYDLSRPGISILIQGLRSTVRDGSNARVEFFYEFQGNAGIPIASYEGGMVNYLREKYTGQKFDLIIALGAPSLEFLLKHETELFPGTPEIFYAHDSNVETVNKLWPHISGVVARLDIARTLDVALALQPETRRVVIVSGSSAQDRFLREQAQADLHRYEDKLELIYLNDLTMEDLKSKLASLPSGTVVLYLSFFLDNRGNAYSGPEALSLFGPSTNAPIYGISDTYVGAGIVGGSVLNFEILGRRTGEMALRVLSGEKFESIPPQTVANTTVFDWKQLRRWGLSERELPPGSIVQFKERTFWAIYKWYIVGIVAACIGEGLLIVWLLILQTRRKRAESERERFAALAESEHRHLDEVVSNLPGLVWETRFDENTGTFTAVYISEYIEELVGYKPEEWTSGMGMARLHEDDRDRVTNECKAAIVEKRESIIQYRWIARDGSTVWVEAHLVPVVNRDKAIGLRGVTLNITEQKLAEEKYRSVFNAANDAILMFEVETGAVVDVNARMGEMYGYSVEEIKRLGIVDLSADQSRHAQDEVQRWIQTAATGEAQLFEWRARHKSGATFWVEISLKRATIGSKDVLLAVVRDTSERKRSMDQLLASEERFGKAFRSNPQPMSITTLSKGRYIDVNESFLEMSGYKRGEVIGHTSRELRIWETNESREAFVKHLHQLGSIVNYETKFRAKSGDLRTLLSSAELIEIAGEQCLLIASSDITERVKAQQDLRESEERFRSIADTAPVLIWMAGSDKRSTYLNRQWMDFTGRCSDDLLGNGWAQDLHPDDRIRALETYSSAFDRKEAFTVESRLRRADGKFRWLYTSGVPRFSYSGEFLGYVGTSVDITDRKESEVAMRTMLEEVNQLKVQLEEENIYLQEEIKLEHNFSEIVGNSDAIKYVLHKIEQVAPTDSTVLIMGETGTGKELAARAIHQASQRRNRPLVKVNCAALSASLIESELFGHEKGAFTGAAARKIGRFELADGATLFLDEIGELPPDLQVKLLRVLQEGEFERLGGTKTLSVDVRLIAATNRNLLQEVQNGRFREDLWYRLNVFPITMPPLRQRTEDIPQLVEHFVDKFSKGIGKNITSIAPATLNAVLSYSWPGNVRELANVIERGVINSRGEVLRISRISEAVHVEAPQTSSKTLEDIERDYIITVLRERGWRIEGERGAAMILGLHPSTLRTRMAKLGIRKPRPDSFSDPTDPFDADVVLASSRDNFTGS